MRSGAQASWQAVHDEVLRRIQDRVWEPGALIPGEAALAEEFGCARATVNRALQALAEAGVLTRKRKAGTRVALSPIRRARLSIPLIREEIESRGAAYGYALIARGTAGIPAALGLRLGLGAGASAAHIEALHLADGQPFVFEDRWVSIAAIPRIDTAPLETVSANEWLVRNVPFSDGELAFFAAAAGAREAAHLGLAPQAAVFVMERVTRSGGAPVTFVRMTYAPGYRMTVTI